jgi:Holliday junction resolvase RusA-like endonuclease
MTLTIELSLPDRALSPNARKCWRAVAAAKKAARANAKMHALAALGRRAAPRWERATWKATFYWPDARRRDDDNAAASCKAYRDGIADAGIVVNDNGFITFPAVFMVDRQRPRVVIEIEEYRE